MPMHSIPLDGQICFTVYKANIAINRAYKPMLDRMGITYPQYLVLSALGEEDGQTIGAIANRLALMSSTITPPLKRLVQAGLVRRESSQSDERRVHVWLTEAGRDLLIDSRCMGQSLLRRSGLTMAQLDDLNRQLQSLSANVVGQEKVVGQE
jgi:DNA-binding MarR family transcriptional regulator